MKLPKGFLHIIDNMKKYCDIAIKLPIPACQLDKYKLVPHILVIYPDYVLVIVLEPLCEAVINEDKIILSTSNFHTFHEIDDPYMQKYDNICKNLSKVWNDMNILSSIFIDVYPIRCHYKISEFITITPKPLSYEYECKYTVYTSAIDMNIDELIEYLKAHFPEYVRPPLIKCAKY
jgi:hypothetical protein